MLAGLLVRVALALACTAAALVATAAWPVHDSAYAGPGTSTEREVHHTARRLRLGIAITFLAVVALAVAATSSWWPEQASSAAARVEITTTSQGTACGTLPEGDPGTIAVSSGGSGSSSRPETSCGCARSPVAADRTSPRPALGLRSR